VSPLERLIREIVAAEGPIPLARYMALCLGHPEHGYYMRKDPLGRAGDFVTAPEVSQMFGELIGLWAAQVWLDMGAPRDVALVELGPGRGTLMADALRAARVAPGLIEAARVHLVETSPALRAKQAEALAGQEVSWHDRFAEVPAGPSIVLANEFLDALPMRQFERREGAWRERVVGLGADGRLALGLAPGQAEPGAAPGFDDAPEGAVFEVSPAREMAAAEIGGRLKRHGGAALLIDYGHARPGLGDTFQAVRAHRFADPLEAPGEADLTSHVDFHATAVAARAAGAHAFGPVGQGEFLRALGIDARAERLARGRDSETAARVMGELRRLAAPDEMGRLFLVLALAAPGLTPPGFGAVEPA
jgi:SAM-dependent MidA family methyltransferase